MDTIKIILIVLAVAYIALAIMIWIYITNGWLFFIFLIINLILFIMIVILKCYDVNLVKNLGETILSYFMKKYGADWIRDVKNVNTLVNKYGNLFLTDPKSNNAGEKQVMRSVE